MADVPWLDGRGVVEPAAVHRCLVWLSLAEEEALQA